MAQLGGMMLSECMQWLVKADATADVQRHCTSQTVILTQSGHTGCRFPGVMALKHLSVRKQRLGTVSNKLMEAYTSFRMHTPRPSSIIHRKG